MFWPATRRVAAQRSIENGLLVFQVHGIFQGGSYTAAKARLTGIRGSFLCDVQLRRTPEEQQETFEPDHKVNDSRVASRHGNVAC